MKTNILAMLAILPVFAFDEATADSETVGGWFMEMLERFPVVGDELRYENFTLKVLEAEERRVDKLLLTIDEPEEEDEDE